MTRAGAVIAAAIAAVLGALTPPVEAALRAGAAATTIALPPGTPLGGYGALARRLWLPDVFDRHPHAYWLRPSTGSLDAIGARALVLDDGATRLAWVAVDLVAIDAALRREIAESLARRGAAPLTLLVSASHTHSGPGAFVDSAVMAVLSMDRLDPAVRTAIVDGIVDAVRRADAARVPARLGAATARAPRLTASRLDRPLDDDVLAVRVTAASGAPVALVWNYAIHGTMLGARNLRLSGDVMGRTTARLEARLGVPALFVNGAVGDVSPARHGQASLDEVARTLAETVGRAWQAAAPAEAPPLRVAERTVALAPPRLSLHNCLGGWAPRALSVSLRRAFGVEAPLVAVAAGTTAIVSIPGELQTALGLEVKRQGRGVFEHVLIAGVSNDYLGYFVTPEDYRRPAYVTCAAIHGPDAGTCLADTATALLYRLRGRERPRAARCGTVKASG